MDKTIGIMLDDPKPKDTNPVILACKLNNVEMLERNLIGGGQNQDDAYNGNRETNVTPDDEDESCHNAFYYAIRSGNVDLLETLVDKWPGSYFAVNFSELDAILSRAYEELKLKNVSLSEEMEIAVVSKLVNLRFFSSTKERKESVKNYVNDIGARIKLVLESISQLLMEYSSQEKVDERFLFIAKFVAQNIHILKHQLRFTYDKLPWEEMEFCLVSFIAAHTKRQEINLFYKTILNKSKMLDHLKIFSMTLEEEEPAIVGADINKFGDLPKLRRVKVVEAIIRKVPQFSKLYRDHQQIRDIYSLEQMRNYIQLASSVDPTLSEGKLIIARALQAIGENFKNTLESPKLSKITYKLLMLSLPSSTRDMIFTLHYLLSHANSLSKRIEIEESENDDFFIVIRNDIRKIDDAISSALQATKTRIITKLLGKIMAGKSSDEIKEVISVYGTVCLEQKISSESSATVSEKLTALIAELSDSIPEKTSDEQSLFNEVNSIINQTKVQLNEFVNDYTIGNSFLEDLYISIGENEIDHNVIKEIKFHIDHLKNIVCKSDRKVNEVAVRLRKIYHSASSRISDSELDEVRRLTCKISQIAGFDSDNLKWIQELIEKINHKSYFDSVYKHCKEIDENSRNQLEVKITQLKDFLKSNTLSGELGDAISFYKRNWNIQASLEMLLLDIMSIFNHSTNILENNLLFLDDSTPLLTGKCLLNHLAHDNVLVDVLLPNSSLSVILNARTLASENVLNNEKKLGKFVADNPAKIKSKFDKDLTAVTNQQNMFAALEAGDLEALQHCLKKGADLKARSFDSWTALHFAAKGSNLDALKFVLNQTSEANVKNDHGQSPLHVAAAAGRHSIVEFLVKTVGVHVDVMDGERMTPLHLAARNGHKATAQVLLENKANIHSVGEHGYTPIYFAIKNNHIDVVKVLLKTDRNVSNNDVATSFTPLHEAVKNGHLELTSILLRNGANVDAANDLGFTPLHEAAVRGHLQIVDALIRNGANVDASSTDGCTALCYVAGYGHEKIASVLLKHGANVNAVSKIGSKTSLHCAVDSGHVGIVRILLENKANVDASSAGNVTPLHIATTSGSLEIMNVLFKHGADANARNDDNATPLYIAAGNGDTGAVKVLIRNRAKVNSRAANSETPLHIASMEGHTDVAEILIKNQANIECQNTLGETPLAAVSRIGNKNLMRLLIKNKANIEARNKNGKTPLYAAINGGHADAVRLLIENRADVNAADDKGCAPLHEAAKAGFEEIVKILITSGANIHSKYKNKTPLIWAIDYNHNKIVEILIENGADMVAGNHDPLTRAVISRDEDIVKILLKHNAHLSMDPIRVLLLSHRAVENGDKEIVNAFIAKGVNVNAAVGDYITALHLAAQEGHDEVVKILIVNRADVNAESSGCTPLHAAAKHGHAGVVVTLLLSGAVFNAKDNQNRTALELAVLNGHLEVVRILVPCDLKNINAPGSDGYTILHMATVSKNIEIVKYLVLARSDIDIENVFGVKAIHIAAVEGFQDGLEFFLSKGQNVNEPCSNNGTPLHYAAGKDLLDIAVYLIAKGADINAKNSSDVTPMHIAAQFGCKRIVELLLKNGADYCAVDKLKRKPIDCTLDKEITSLLTVAENLFEAVRQNNPSKVGQCIEAGAPVNVKQGDGRTSLHYAARKGYQEVVIKLLQNKADPNATDTEGFTALHYAAQSAHLETVKTLLSHDAVYEVVSNSGKTPTDLAADKNIFKFLKLIKQSFRKVKADDTQVINDLNKISDIETIKAVMRARNRENKTLIVVAMNSGYSEVGKLKRISQDDGNILRAELFLRESNFKSALKIVRSILEIRKEILGPDNPGTLDMQVHIAKILREQGAYREASNLLEEVFQKQKEILGPNAKDTLNTRSIMANALARQGKNDEALAIFQEVFEAQKNILGLDHSDTIETHFGIHYALYNQGKHEEALRVGREIEKKAHKSNDPNFYLRVQNNMAVLLIKLGKHEEALNSLEEVLEKKKIHLGKFHPDTIRTIQSIGTVLLAQQKNQEAFNTFREVLEMQQHHLGPNHPETLMTHFNMARTLQQMNNNIGALKVYQENIDKMKAVYGATYPVVLEMLQAIEVIKNKLQGDRMSEHLQQMQKNFKCAAANGNIQTVQRLLLEGIDVNDKDLEGRTPLHFAICNDQTDVASILLSNGADVTQATSKGNTPLHSAVSKCSKELVELLLQRVSCDKLSDFVNAKTTSTGSMALHVAAKNGSFEIVKTLLSHGAAFNAERKDGKSPVDLSNNHEVKHLLQITEKLFNDVQTSDAEVISRLKALSPDEFSAVTKARNNHGHTLLQVAITNKHKVIAGSLLKMLKEPEQNSLDIVLVRGIKVLKL